VVAYLVDFLPALLAQALFLVGYLPWVLELSRATAVGAPVDFSVGAGWMVAGLALGLVAVGWTVYNRWLMGGRTGQSLGKRLLKLTLVAEETRQPIGPLNAFLRDLVHILDGMAYVGYLWPLWDKKRQTFADMLMRTVVIDERPVGTAPAAPRGAPAP
jgi:uncharacterized RDD family membrane protein YckC